MSHNLYTLNNEGGDVQCYHGANDGVIYIGRGETQTYAGTLNPASSWSTNFEFYDSNPINTIAGASFTKRSGTNWIQSITLPAGTYEIRCSCLAPTSASNADNLAINYFILSSSTNKYPSQNGISEGIFNTSSKFADENFSYLRSDCSVFTLSTSTNIFFLMGFATILSAPATITSDDRISETAYIFIRKLS